MRSLAIIGFALCAWPLVHTAPHVVAPLPAMINSYTCGHMQAVLVEKRADAVALQFAEHQMHFRVQYPHSAYAIYDRDLAFAKQKRCML